MSIYSIDPRGEIIKEFTDLNGTKCSYAEYVKEQGVFSCQ
jgi:hypothetical protein